MTPLATLARRAVHHWPRKLGALLVALTVWLVVTTDETAISQRSLLVPIVVEGLGGDLVAAGLPDVVEVTVSGPSARIDRLRPESFEAVLELSDVVGDFQADVQVAGPQGITLERVNPNEVIGVLEAITNRAVPVRAAVIGAVGPDERLRPSVEPGEARVRGRATIVAQVAAVVAPILAEEARGGLATTAPLHAIDADGRPLLELVVTPERVAVDVAVEDVLVERRVPLTLFAPGVPGWSDPTGAPADVAIAAPATVLEDLDEVGASVDLPTDPPASGRYTRPLALALPPGAVALEAPTVSVRYDAPPLEP